MSELVRFKSEEYGDLLVEVDDEQGDLEVPPAEEDAEDFDRVALEKLRRRVTDAAVSFEETIDPVVKHAKQVLESLRELQPDGVEVEFGIKIEAAAGVLAKVGGEANFNVRLTWERGDPH